MPPGLRPPNTRGRKGLHLWYTFLPRGSITYFPDFKPRQIVWRNMSEVYGYARVSTTDQNEDRQLIALQKAGVSRDKIIVDKRSGQDFNRPGWKRLKRMIKRGDLLVVQSIDRLGRNYNEIISEWQHLVKIRGTHIKVVNMPLLDTSVSQGLMAEFIGDLVLQILSFVAQSERDAIKTRQREGIDAAKARGVKFGRPMIMRPEDFSVIAKSVLTGKISMSKAAEICAVSRTTFRRWMSAL